MSKTRTNDYIFDWDTMLSFEGNTAPYLQYAYTRIISIFRKAELDVSTFKGNINITETKEKALALKLVQFGEILQQVADEAYPHILCNYLYEIASAYMAFYEQCPILKANIKQEIKESRLALSLIVADTLAKGLELLGIEIMEKM